MEEQSSPPPQNMPPPVSPPPPPMSPPPLLPQPAPQPKPRRGRGWMIFALILLVLLVISMLFNIGNFASSLVRGKPAYTHTVGPRLEEVLTEDNDSSMKVAVIEISGIITSRIIDQGGYSMVDLIKAQLKRADEDHKVKAVLLKVDSPGGEVLASDEIYRAISDFQGKAHKPVVAAMGNLAASGGYYVSAPCQWIVANDLTITGSIGVILHSWNYRGLMDKVGLRPQTYKSGKFKDMLSGERDPDREIPDEERKMVQNLIDETYHKFQGVVSEGRKQAWDKNKASSDPKDKGRPLAKDWKDYADGRVLSGSEAQQLGFVDELGNFEDAFKRARKLAGIGSANLIEYQQRFDISDIFRLFGKSQAPVVKVDVGVEMPKLQAGQLYFLSPTFLH